MGRAASITQTQRSDTRFLPSALWFAPAQLSSKAHNPRAAASLRIGQFGSDLGPIRPAKEFSRVPLRYEHQGRADGRCLSLAEWRRRAMGWDLPTRTVGSRDRHQRVASEEVGCLFYQVLPRGSHALWSAQADTARTKALLRPRNGSRLASCRWPSSSLPARRLSIATLVLIPSPRRLPCFGVTKRCFDKRRLRRGGAQSLGSHNCFFVELGD
jgi:hypothetical protein